MRQLLISIISFCLFLSFFSCEKDIGSTVINLKFIDKKSKKPLSNVAVYISFSYETSVRGSIKTTADQRNLVSDNNGEIKNVVFEDSDYSGYQSDAKKSGYVSIMHILNKIERGKQNDITVEMSPLDGYLTVIVENQTGLSNGTYVGLVNQTIKSAGKGFADIIFLKYQFITLKKGDPPYSQTFALPAEEYTLVYWGKDPIASNSVNLLKDSVLVPLLDTTKYKLIF